MANTESASDVCARYMLDVCARAWNAGVCAGGVRCDQDSAKTASMKVSLRSRVLADPALASVPQKRHRCSSANVCTKRAHVRAALRNDSDCTGRKVRIAEA